MIKRTLYFGNPAYLSTRNEQLIVKAPEIEKNDTIPDDFKTLTEKTIPIEDIGVLILDHARITISQPTIAKLLANNVALICCDESRHPTGLMLNLDGNSIQAERYKHQLAASIPLKKQLWQQTIRVKIRNQAQLLQQNGSDAKIMFNWAEDVKSGDTANHESRAAVYYWQRIFAPLDFYRKRDGNPPNNLLNYGYAILRAATARSLVGSGLLPTLGIFHRNRYNAYALADDIMEPYRPYVDQLVLEILREKLPYKELNTDLKARLLKIPALDIQMDGEISPLMVALQRTTASLARCYAGEQRRIIYPEM
ncbi:MAG: type II CRISPR-associated endonuclease Cas1 [Bacteroidia bacterium]|nr:type II CRISPR-associated endonuclease Cas1 [Bacteroidia bacterium]